MRRTSKMTLLEQIEHVFADRLMPSHLVEEREPATPEQRDALFFSGRDWREITWQDWEKHPDAFFAFVPEAFIYYLPSIIRVAVKNPGQWLGAVDALLRVLDRSPNSYHWDNFIEKRFVGLRTEEYEVIKDWILSLSGTNVFADEDTLSRCYETTELLQNETKRVRVLLR